MHYVESFSRPGGNETGFTPFEPSLGGKWVSLLKEVAPNVEHIGIVYNPEPGNNSWAFRKTIDAALDVASGFVIDKCYGCGATAGRMPLTSDGSWCGKSQYPRHRTERPVCRVGRDGFRNHPAKSPIGPAGPWPRRLTCRSGPSSASGRRISCSPIAGAPLGTVEGRLLSQSAVGRPNVVVRRYFWRWTLVAVRLVSGAGHIRACPRIWRTQG